MDREHLTRLVEDPTRVQREDIADLKAMAERYPWFSGAHLLLAVGGHAAGDVLFDEQLRVAAAHLPSRAVLFDRSERSAAEEGAVLVRVPRPITPVAEPPAPPVITLPSPVVEVAPPPPVVNVAPPPVEEPIAPTALVEAVEAEVPVEAIAIEEALPEVEVPIEEVMPELEPEQEQVTEEATGQFDPLDEVIRGSALTAAFALALEDEIAKVPVPAPPPATVASAPATPLAGSGRLKFTQWLTVSDEATTPASGPAAAAPAASASTTAQAPAEKRSPAADLPGAGLIQELIQQQSRQKPKAEFFDPQRAAKRSLDDHADLVTETLARIYEKQGNYAKAIAAYERLAVKHPEKRDYFRGLANLLQGL